MSYKKLLENMFKMMVELLPVAIIVLLVMGLCSLVEMAIKMIILSGTY